MCPVDPWVRIRLPRGEWFYDPVRPLGPAGGFGEVFEGKDQAGQLVAVKRLKATAGEAAHRELKIAEELAGKSFEHVLGVFDSGEDSEGGSYFVVMPRAERSLADELEKRGMPPFAEATDILTQIAEGLKEVEDLIHRDLKPANVLYHDGRWKIADFGIARFVEDATSANTVRDFLSAPYAAPEQWKGEHATHATDVYALSCMAYVLLTGEPPFPGPTSADFQQQHTTQNPPLLTGTDVRVRAIFSAGLRKPQSGRPPIDRVIAVLREVSANAAPPTPGIAALQAVNAAEAERVSAAAADAERERRKNADRTALIDWLPRRGLVKEKAAINPEKIRELLAALPEPSGSVAQLLVLTGLRIGELLALRWRDVDLEHCVLRVTQTVYEGVFDEPKSQRSRRSVPLGAKCIEILSARKPAAVNLDTLVFSTDRGTAFDRHNLINRQLKPTCKKLGLTGVNWHWLRHANATLLDAVGTPLGTVQALLGHSSSEITREVYLHSIPADARAAVEKVEGLLNRPKLTQVAENWKTGSLLIQ